MKSRPNIIFIDGATGAGKSTVLRFLRDTYRQSVTVGAKLTTRRRRPTDNGWEFRFVDHIPAEHERYSFVSVGNHYAIEIGALREAISCGSTYAVSCVDRRTIERLKCDFVGLVIYIYRTWGHDEFEMLLTSRGATDDADCHARRREMAFLAAEYASKIEMYDHVLLNLGTPSDLVQQLSRILEAYDFAPDATALGGL